MDTRNERVPGRHGGTGAEANNDSEGSAPQENSGRRISLRKKADKPVIAKVDVASKPIEPTGEMEVWNSESFNLRLLIERDYRNDNRVFIATVRNGPNLLHIEQVCVPTETMMYTSIGLVREQVIERLGHSIGRYFANLLKEQM